MFSIGLSTAPVLRSCPSGRCHGFRVPSHLNLWLLSWLARWQDAKSVEWNGAPILELLRICAMLPYLNLSPMCAIVTLTCVTPSCTARCAPRRASFPLPLPDFDEPLEVVKHLFVGSEGTFGFVSRATYHSVPLPIAIP